jgi:hypothetical protein
LQTNGPLQNAGPLQPAAPLQNTAPNSGPPGGLESLTNTGSPLLPPPDNNPVNFGGAPFGPTGGPTMQQLIAQMLAGPDGTSAPTLVSMVNTLTSPGSPPSGNPPGTPSGPPPIFTPINNPTPPGPPIVVPTYQLPPVYDTPPSQQQSQR